MPKLKAKIHPIFPLLLFLSAYLIFSVFTYKDYGITSDEDVGYRDAGFLYDHFSQTMTFENTIVPYSTVRSGLLRDLPLLSDHNRLYPMTMLLLNPSGSYETFHFQNLLFYSFIFICGYLAVFHATKSKFYALLFTILLFLTPRLLGDAPANQKDMPFAVLYFISLCLIYYYGQVKNSKAKYLVLGLFLGLTQSFRVVGLTLYVIFVLYQVYCRLLEKSQISLKDLFDIAIETVTIFLIGLLVHAASQPYLGVNIPNHFISLALKSAKYSEWSGTITFMGHPITAYQRPWYYLFVWLGISTPVYLIALSATSLLFIKKLIKAPFYFINLLSFIMSIIIYLVLHPVIYNGIRHYLFILPNVCVFALYGFKSIYEKLGQKNVKYLLVALLSLGMFKTSWDLVKLYPYFYVYFNEFVDGVKGAQNKFDLDYWGTSYKEAIQWVNSDLDPLVEKTKIYSCGGSFTIGYYKDPLISTVDYFKNPKTGKAAVTYLICHKKNEILSDKWDTVYEVKRDGAVLNTVKKLRSDLTL